MQNEKQKLWIVSELFYPEESTTAFILTAIAEKLTEKYQVYVLAGTPVYEIDDSKVHKNLENINITRIKAPKIDKNNLLQRLRRAFFVARKMKRYLQKNVSSKDKIFMVTNPVLNTLFIPRWAKRKNIDFTLLVNDVFPENAVQAGILKEDSLIFKLLKKSFDKSYSCVSRCIACGRDMKNVLIKKTKNKVPVEVIENWADTERIKPEYKMSRSENKIVLKFAGNIGRVQGLDDFVKIASKAKNDSLEFVFAGNGAEKPNLIQLAKDLGLKNIRFEDSYTRAKENEVLNSCDIALVCLGREMYGLGVPSKTYNCMAAGKPILFIGPKNSEIYKEVEENKIGYPFSFDDEEKIVQFLEKLNLSDLSNFQELGRNARKCAEEKYSKEIILNKYLEIL